MSAHRAGGLPAPALQPGGGQGGSPRKKQTASETLQSSMLGPTLPSARPMCASCRSPGLRGSLCEGDSKDGVRAGQRVGGALLPAQRRPETRLSLRAGRPAFPAPADPAVPAPLLSLAQRDAGVFGVSVASLPQ